MKTPLVLRYFIGSMLIFAISMIIVSTRALRSLEMESTSYAFGRFYQPDFRVANRSDVPIKILPIYEPMSQDVFLGIAKDIVHRLKSVGAKVVIIPLPEYVRASPAVLESMREISRDSIVLFGVPGSPVYGNERNRPDDRSRWWAHHPAYHKLDISWGAMTAAPRDFSFLIPFVPTGYRDDDSGSPVPDVGVLAMKRFLGIPDKAELPTASSRLQLGPYAIPIEHDGLCYTKFQWTSSDWMDLSATYPAGKDSLQFFPTSVYGWTNKAAIDSAWQAHKGKIVLIDWVGLSNYPYSRNAWIYAHILNSIFTRTFIRIHNEWNVLLITTLVILLSVLSYTVRNGFMIFVSLVLAVGAMAISVWLFGKHDVLFEPMYVMVPIILSGVILPIVKVVGEKRLVEEKIKSLEDENKRLSDLLRPPSSRDQS